MILQPAATSDARSITCISSESSTEAQRPKLEVQLETGLLYRSYYYPGSQRIAMRVQEGKSSDVYWFPADRGTLRSHTDHLGSTSLLSTITGTLVADSTTRFMPRYSRDYGSLASTACGRSMG